MNDSKAIITLARNSWSKEVKEHYLKDFSRDFLLWASIEDLCEVQKKKSEISKNS